MTAAIPAPPRFQHRSLTEYLGIIVVIALVVTSIANTAPALDSLQRGLARLVSPSGFLAQMFPPDLSRVDHIAWKLLETLQMAVAGAALGLVFAVPFAILATDRLSPHPIVKIIARGLIAFFRTVPDLVWAIFFIIVVGLGPAAGVLALMKGLSRTYASEGLLVNAVSPAFISTPMTDAMMEKRAAALGVSTAKAIETFLDEERPYMELKRRGEPDEVANVIAFLCSDAASFVNGSNYRVDSGSVATI
mgnify:CR=1 FL=1